ncbi:hypothetical protein HDU87_001670, partial [Geranomyces variabilis]
MRGSASSQAGSSRVSQHPGDARGLLASQPDRVRNDYRGYIRAAAAAIKGAT